MTATIGSDLAGKTNPEKVNACKARLEIAIKAAGEVESSVRWLVRERAWEVLGYPNLSEMWEAHAGFKCPTYVKAVATDALLKEEGTTPRRARPTENAPGHTNATIAMAVGMPVRETPRGHLVSPTAGTVINQLQHGVPPDQITTNKGARMRDTIATHGSRSYEHSRKRAQPRRMGAAPDELISASVHVPRRDADAIAEIARQADVPAAEIYRQAVAEYLMRHRESRPGVAS